MDLGIPDSSDSCLTEAVRRSFMNDNKSCRFSFASAWHCWAAFFEIDSTEHRECDRQYVFGTDRFSK